MPRTKRHCIDKFKDKLLSDAAQKELANKIDAPTPTGRVDSCPVLSPSAEASAQVSQGVQPKWPLDSSRAVTNTSRPMTPVSDGEAARSNPQDTFPGRVDDCIITNRHASTNRRAESSNGSNYPSQRKRPRLPIVTDLSSQRESSPTNMATYIQALQSSLQRLPVLENPDTISWSQKNGASKAPVSAYREGLRQCRESITLQTIEQSVTNQISSSMSRSIAMEIKASIGCCLSPEQRDPEKTIGTFLDLGRRYGARLYQRSFENSQYMSMHARLLEKVYSPDDVKRVLYFWATQHEHLFYDDISFILHLPRNVLLHWIFRFTYPVVAA